MSSLRRRRPSLPKARDLLLDELSHAAMLVERGKIADAIDLAEELAKRFPGRPEPYEFLVSLYFETEDPAGLERAAYQLVELRPDDPDPLLMLATAHAANERVAMGLRLLDQFLERWPEAPQRSEVEALRSEMRTEALPIILDLLGLDGERAAALAVLHERVVFFTEQGRFVEARRSVERLLKEHPAFVPALNNYSQILALQGEFARAIEICHQSLEQDPDNVFALSHLVRCHFLLGHRDLAEEAWEGLARIEACYPEWVTKQAEAGSYLGKDAEVHALMRRVEPLSALREVPGAAYLLHLLAAAACRVGAEKDARRLWKEALVHSPAMDLARLNLEDLQLPPGERHGAWPFTLSYWVPPQWMDKLGEAGDRISRASDDASQRAISRRLLKEIPALRGLMPVLLERGDPLARTLMALLAVTHGDAESAAVLRDFALDRWGPDELRIHAAEKAIQLGAMDPGHVRLWIGGEQREMLLLGFELHWEPDDNFKPAALRHLQSAAEAMADGNPVRAEAELSAALRANPRTTPKVLYSRALIRKLEGHLAEGEELLRQAYEADPDYLFPRTALATAAAFRGDFAQARELLAPLLRLRRLHYSEYAALCAAQVQLLMAEKHWAGARDWLDLWERAIPDHPDITPLRKRLPRALRR